MLRLTPEEEEAIRLDQERTRQQQARLRLGKSGCICGGAAAAGPNGLTLALETEAESLLGVGHCIGIITRAKACLSSVNLGKSKSRFSGTCFGAFRRASPPGLFSWHIAFSWN